MTPEGYRTIVAALENEEIDAIVIPPPQEGEDIRYVGIRRRDHTLSHLRVLNVLDNAGLMYQNVPRKASFMSRETPRNSVSGDTPQLDLITIEAETGIAIFEDKNAKN